MTEVLIRYTQLVLVAGFTGVAFVCLMQSKAERDINQTGDWGFITGVSFCYTAYCLLSLINTYRRSP